MGCISTILAPIQLIVQQPTTIWTVHHTEVQKFSGWEREEVLAAVHQIDTVLRVFSLYKQSFSIKDMLRCDCRQLHNVSSHSSFSSSFPRQDIHIHDSIMKSRPQYHSYMPYFMKAKFPRYWIRLFGSVHVSSGGIRYPTQDKHH